MTPPGAFVPAPDRDDPQGLIGQVLAMGDEFQGYAEDILLSWLLSLPAEIDPGAAAQRLLDRHGIAAGPAPDGPIGRVWRLLRETARHPHAAQDRQRGARRGGRRRTH